MWWERWPDRFEQEMQCLRKHNLEPVDTSTQEGKAQGFRSVEVKWCATDDQPLRITLKFPSEYPFFMALAFLDPTEKLLTRHQNPLSGELCLLNAGQSWKPKDFIGDVLMEMLPKIVRINDEPHGDFAKEQEVGQGEPVTGYLPKSNRSFLLIEDIEIPKHYEEGTFEARVLPPKKNESRYALTEVKNRSDGQSVSASPKLKAQLEGFDTIKGHWKRLKFGVEDIQSGLNISSLAQEIHKPTYQSLKTRPVEGLLLALIKEEVKQSDYQDSWIGVHLSTQHNRGSAKRKRPKKANLSIVQKVVFGAPYDATTRWARSPELRELEGKHVCIVGAGMLGSPIALQLARAGVGKLSVVDFDYVELATIVRYGLGGRYVGWSKVEALEHYIQNNYFFTEFEPIRYQIGDPNSETGNLATKFHAAIHSADLVIDAAAERNVSYYINDILTQSKTPWVAVTTRPGSWGGETWIMRPGGPCWACFEAYNLDETLPMANGDDDGQDLQIGGCTKLTTTGYGFDSDSFAINTVRSAIGLLTSDESGYPTPDWDALVMNVRDGKGSYIGPEFTPYTLPRRLDCCCNSGNQ